MSIAIHWFRRDLRLTDNTGLNAAAARCEQVIPVYIVSAWQRAHRWCGAPRQEFLCGCLASLARNLEHKGGRLIIRHGSAEQALEALVRESGAEEIHFARDPDPFGRAIDEKIIALGARLGVAVFAHKDHAMHERDEVLTGAGRYFQVFTPYSRAWTKLDKAAPGKALARISVPPQIASEPLPTLDTWGLQSTAKVVEPGEAAARKRLGRFLDGPVLSYDAHRNFPATPATSRISQDLRWGLLSIRDVYARCQEVAAAHPSQRKGVDIFINELIWREFYFQVLWHRPEVLQHELQEQYRSLPWKDHWRPGERPSSEEFQRWCRGETGFPIVDAGMRELAATGYMHNRVRMITAMFLTKDLHIWWMHGESWFMRQLVDGEIASNNGGWQWSSSTGTDAAPYFRIQNPWAQTERFDPKGDYIKTWVPELKHVHPVALHTVPAPGLSVAPGYPRPMVDHNTERDVAIAMFQR